MTLREDRLVELCGLKESLRTHADDHRNGAWAGDLAWAKHVIVNRGANPHLSFIVLSVDSPRVHYN